MTGTLTEKSKKMQHCSKRKILSENFKKNCLSDYLTYIIGSTNYKGTPNTSKLP